MITEEQIWNYLDGSLSEAERKEVERSIAADKQSMDLFTEISALNRYLKQSSLLSPSLSFTGTVMAAIAQQKPFTAPVVLPIKALLLFLLPSLALITAFAAVLAYGDVQLSTLAQINIPMPDFSRFKIYLIAGYILILAYLLDKLSEHRFNRKALLS
ncbi:hypothetical protein [uncultured Mucilaginibacter sp.]|uniref:anti-sigma factor family protein n=1 Tax=uncultured Mucilaginibacter sp. TaxID=797541 RepID=UPI0025EAA2E1|nr:hypothetical protein [uncultured Mucilaginibacter sp.]